MIGLVRATPLLALALVASCGKAPDEEASIADLDNALAQVNGAASANDPVLQSALKDQIMVDPALVQQANADTVRPPMQPESGAVPPDGIASAAMTGEKDDVRPAPPPGECKQCALARQVLSRGAQATARGGAANCAGNVAYSAAWANRLPPGVPLYPDARVAEAAGADADGCALRVVSFASAAPPERLLAWYFTKASNGGYRAEHALRGGEHVLGGTKSGGAFLLTVKPRKDGGSDVDLMADAGA